MIILPPQLNEEMFIFEESLWIYVVGAAGVCVNHYLCSWDAHSPVGENTIIYLIHSLFYTTRAKWCAGTTKLVLEVNLEGWVDKIRCGFVTCLGLCISQLYSIIHLPWIVLLLASGHHSLISCFFLWHACSWYIISLELCWSSSVAPSHMWLCKLMSH